MNVLKLKYHLTKDEIEESLLCLEWKKEGKLKSVNLGIMCMLGMMILVVYMKRPGHFPAFLLLAIIVFLLFYMWYVPQWRRKRQAKKLEEKGGEYRISISESGIRFGEKNERREWENNKFTLFISNQMFTLKTDREFFAIPKRILSEKEQMELLKVTRKYQIKIINVVIKKE
ncbi:MAG: hypothetical protein ACI4S2_05500 [Lachnospiraceae bacterium]